jgi:YHS domain-containing protein
MGMYKSLFSTVRLSSLLFTAISLFIFSCQEKAPKQTTMAPMASSDTSTHRFTAAMVDNKKDPGCGMPVTAGIKDTVHYNGKVYGFCSDECRDAFLKDPAVMAKATEMK